MGVYVIGAGGHAKVVVSTLLAAGIPVDGLFDDDMQKIGSVILGVKVLGTLADAKALAPQSGVIGIGDNRARKRIAEEFAGWEWLSVVHPRAFVHPSVRIGPGTVVFAGAVIEPDAYLGAHVIINTGVTVDHDCVIQDFVHLAPGVHLAGSVVIEEGALLGVGAVAIPKVRVGSWAIVGAGEWLLATAIGVPARPVTLCKGANP